MKRDTRSDILQAARVLFNEHGFNAVSIRDIAAEAGISSGNLTYHFRKKEDIMEALLSENSPLDTAPPHTLEALDAFFSHQQQIMKEHAYYFRHFIQLSQLSPEIQAKQQQRHQYNVATLLAALEALHGAGLLHPPGYEEEYARVVDALLVASVNWDSFCALKPEGTATSYRQHAWSLLYHLLTDSARPFAAAILEI